MSEPTTAAAYPYATHLNVLFDAMQTIDVGALVGRVEDEWYNQTLCKVNDSVVRVGVIRGEYHWHKHQHEDEFFFVLSGRLLIDFERRDDDEPGKVVALEPKQGFVVPRGVVHRTRASERTVILMVETANVIPTGD
jgi:mannose-6-phosphate isomerase-like protein (cupin superfamily)